VVDLRPVVVSFGAAKFNSCSRGHATGPVEGVRRALRERGVEHVHDAQKHYTNQLCNSFSKAVPMYTEGGGPGRGKGKGVYGVRRCLTLT
jgi:hypothetical protein